MLIYYQINDCIITQKDINNNLQVIDYWFKVRPPSTDII